MPLSAQALVEPLGTLLGLSGAIDVARAQLNLELAIERAETVVVPVPDGARSIILDVASRGYSNQQGTTAETAGPFSRTLAMPGVYLTKRERADLKSLAGKGGAFTVNPTAADAGPPALPTAGWPYCPQGWV